MTEHGEADEGLTALVTRLERVYLLSALLVDGEPGAGTDFTLRALVLHRIANLCREIAGEAGGLGGQAQESARAEGAIEVSRGGGEWWTQTPGAAGSPTPGG
jgi:hypothetical protein